VTQEKLAAMSNVSTRTIQRAEKGEHVQRETATNIAAALKARMAELVVENAGEVRRLLGPENRELILQRVTSGKALLEIVYDSFSGEVSCQVEPPAGRSEVLAQAVEELSALAPSPWQARAPMSLADRVRTAATLNERIEALAALDIAIFAGTYAANRQVPRINAIGERYVDESSRFEHVRYYRVIFEEGSREFVLVKVRA
jgi:hypothetical protein